MGLGLGVRVRVKVRVLHQLRTWLGVRGGVRVRVRVGIRVRVGLRVRARVGSKVRGPPPTSEPMSKNVPSKCDRIAQKVPLRVTCYMRSKVVRSSRKVAFRVTCYMSSKVVRSSRSALVSSKYSLTLCVGLTQSGMRCLRSKPLTYLAG